jgi:hypothetical protein
MSLRGKIGAAVTHSRHDGKALTAPAREAFLKRFLDEVDPNRQLPEPERERRAEHARRAHMLRIARLSALARSRKAEPALAS